MRRPRIYFAGSIRGGRDDARIYAEIIAELRRIGTVLTEHVGAGELTDTGESARTDDEIHERDMAWLAQSDIVVAEVSVPSLGVGYELGRAEAMGKPVACLFRPASGRRLSAMVGGNRAFHVLRYVHPTDVVEPIRRLLDSGARGAPYF
jgi:hypothetical protein